MPNNKYRAKVTPAKRGKGRKTRVANGNPDQSPAERHAAMTWEQRLKRVFDIETCSECGGDVKIMASIEDPEVIRAVLTHLDQKGHLPEVVFSRIAGLRKLHLWARWFEKMNPTLVLTYRSPLLTAGSGRVLYGQMSELP